MIKDFIEELINGSVIGITLLMGIISSPLYPIFALLDEFRITNNYSFNLFSSLLLSTIIWILAIIYYKRKIPN